MKIKRVIYDHMLKRISKLEDLIVLKNKIACNATILIQTNGNNDLGSWLRLQTNKTKLSDEELILELNTIFKKIQDCDNNVEYEIMPDLLNVDIELIKEL